MPKIATLGFVQPSTRRPVRAYFKIVAQIRLPGRAHCATRTSRYVVRTRGISEGEMHCAFKYDVRLPALKERGVGGAKSTTDPSLPEDDASSSSGERSILLERVSSDDDVEAFDGRSRSGSIA